jgi:hypothetical protein
VSRRGRVWWAATAICGLTLSMARIASAEPYLAAQQGYRCVQCHVNPTGGGLRNDFGLVYAKTLLPANPLAGGADRWSGKFFNHLRLGADARGSWTRTRVPGQQTVTDDGLDQLRVYADLEMYAERVAVVLDEHVSPGDRHELELYARAGDPSKGWYLKGGRFYVPFGWRFQDSTTFVRGVSGMNMLSPDEGLELGFERTDWSAQLVASKGGVGSGGGIGDRLIGQFVWVQSVWRAGGALAEVKSSAGKRDTLGLFGSWRSGKLTWLGEADLIHDDSFRPRARTLAALLGEANWNWRRGHNVKLTAEFYDADRAVANDGQTRLSLVYEYTPLPFIQLRAGVRQYDGIPQSPFQNRSFGFIELHGFL